VALFASWSVFRFIGEHQPGSVLLNAGYERAEGSSPRMRELSELQFRVMSPWDSVRHDYITLEMALEHLRIEKPRVLYIALGETDDWAHDRRYDRTLQTVEYFDRALQQIWEFVEESPDYRGRTSLVITSDHGRGSTIEDWHGHGAKVAGAEQIWAAVYGPDTPARGEISGAEAFQRDVAPTMLDLLGIDYREYKGVLGRPIASARSR
jgi:phosphopentomutase